MAAIPEIFARLGGTWHLYRWSNQWGRDDRSRGAHLFQRLEPGPNWKRPSHADFMSFQFKYMDDPDALPVMSGRLLPGTVDLTIRFRAIWMARKWALIVARRQRSRARNALLCLSRAFPACPLLAQDMIMKNVMQRI